MACGAVISCIRTIGRNSILLRGKIDSVKPSLEIMNRS